MEYNFEEVNMDFPTLESFDRSGVSTTAPTEVTWGMFRLTQKINFSGKT